LIALAGTLCLGRSAHSPTRSAAAGDAGSRSRPLVSVVISSYNYGRFLDQAIASALDQTYDRVEVIVVDDGSTDDSRSVIRRYDERIIPIFQQNGGQASAINAGFARSRGEIVIFLDADDVLAPDIVARVVETLRRNPDAAKIQSRMEVIDESSQRTGIMKPHPHLPLPNGDFSRHCLRFPGDTAWLPTSGNAFPAAILRQLLPMPEAPLRINADSYLCQLSLLFGPVISLEQIGSFYRLHGANHHELTAPALDLNLVRRNIVAWREVHGRIPTIAAALDLPDRPRSAADVHSVTDTAHRLISLKLDAARHPTPDDRLLGLIGLGIRAAGRRFDVPPAMKLLFVLWFSSMALAPRPLARWLAALWLLPEKRGGFNALLGRLHAARRPPAAPAGAARR
jgi:hypothetical protein